MLTPVLYREESKELQDPGNGVCERWGPATEETELESVFGQPQYLMGACCLGAEQPNLCWHQNLILHLFIPKSHLQFLLDIFLEIEV